jgi:transposase InsO family protein
MVIPIPMDNSDSDSDRNADATSRSPTETNFHADDAQFGDPELQAASVRTARLKRTEDVTVLDITPDRILEVQRQDPVMSFLMERLQAGGPRPVWSDVQSGGEEMRTYAAQYDSLVLNNDLLCRRFIGDDGSFSHFQIIMPVSLRSQFIRLLHTTVGSAHLGVKKTLEHVRQRAYWPGWTRDVERVCRQCIICASYQQGKAPRHGKLCVNEASGVWDRLHIDLVGPVPRSRQGSVYLLTVVDAYCRYLIGIPLRDKTALHVAVALVDKVFCVYGFPRAILSDRGTEFCNAILDDVTRLLGIQKLRTTAYRPSANSRAERSHKTLHALFAKTIAADAKDWEDKLPAVTAAYNAAYHETTGLSPFFLMHGRTFRTPVDLMMDVPEEAKAKTYTEYGDQLEETLRSAFCLVNQSLNTTTQRMKQRYDAKVHEKKFAVGDFVWYYCPRRKRGRFHKWSRLCEIHRVDAVKDAVNYVIRRTPKSKSVVVHVDRLRKCEADTPHCWQKVLDSDQGDNPSPHQLLNQNRVDAVPGSTSGATSPSAADNAPVDQAGSADSDAVLPKDVQTVDSGLPAEPTASQLSPSNQRPVRTLRKPARYRRVIQSVSNANVNID